MEKIKQTATVLVSLFITVLSASSQYVFERKERKVTQASEAREASLTNRQASQERQVRQERHARQMSEARETR